jgi:hypothetical protein
MKSVCEPGASAACSRRSGASTGPLILIGFGTAWLLAANQVANGPAIGYLVVAVFGTAMVAESLRLDRKTSLTDRLYSGRRWNTRIRNQFIIVNVLQYAGIALAIFACNFVGQPERITGCALAVIGFHFIPLARLFRAPLYYATGVVMAICGVLSAWIGTDTSVTTGAFAAGLTLWTTAAIVLFGWRRRLARD